MSSIWKKKKSMAVMLVLLFCILAAVAVLWNRSGKDQESERKGTESSEVEALANMQDTSENIEKKVILQGCIDWMYISYEAVMENAAIVVHGKVIEEGEMYKDESTGNYCRKDIIEIIEAFRGADSQDTVIFKELGGETEDAIYKWDTVELVDLGKEYIFFLNEDGSYINPSTVVPVNGDTVTTFLYSGNEGHAAREIPLEEYLETARNWKPTTGIAEREMPENFMDIKNHVSAIAYGKVVGVKMRTFFKNTVKVQFEIADIMYGADDLDSDVGSTILIEQEKASLPLLAEAEVGEEYIFFIKEDQSLWAMVRVVNDKVSSKINSTLAEEYAFTYALDYTLEQYLKMMRYLAEPEE